MSEKNNLSKQIYERYLARTSRDDEHGDWAEYRAALTDYILAHTRPGSSLLILGAGKCNDLDLGKLANHCGEITLSDYRSETAEDALRRYGLTPSEHLRFRAADYAGITDEDYLTYTEHLLTVMQRLAGAPEEAARRGPLAGVPEDPAGTQSLRGIKQAGASPTVCTREEPARPQSPAATLEELAGPALAVLQTTLKDIYRRNEAYEVHLGEQAYDHAIVCGVHSQLNNAFRGLFQFARQDVEARMGQVRCAEELNAAIFQTTRAHTGAMIERFNEAVFAAVREGIIYGYEDHILFTPAGADGPVRGTVDGARQAGEAIAGRSVRDRWETVWPLSRHRRIEFEMVICYVPVQAEDSKLD